MGTAQISALPLPAQQTGPLVELLGKTFSRARELERGWDMCQRKCKMQQKYLTQIKDLYCDDFHIVAVPMLGEEVRGIDSLRAFAKLLRGEGRTGGRALPVRSGGSDGTR